MAEESTTAVTQVRIASGLVLAIGLWLFVGGFLYGDPVQVATPWNNVLLGLLIAFTAAVRLAKPDRFPMLGYVLVLLGLWLAATPFILGYTEFGGATWADLVMGVAVAVLGLWSALVSRSRVRT